MGLGTSTLASSLDCRSNGLCAAAIVLLIHGWIGVRYTTGEQGNQTERCFLFRKDELLDGECFFLKSVGLLSMFHPGQILAWAGVIPTLLLWYDILSSLLFVPHDF